MKSRLTLAILFVTSLPLLASAACFAQNFQLQFTGGVVNIGASPMNIVVSNNGGGTTGKVVNAVPPASSSCTAAEAVTLAGKVAFRIIGTTTQFGHQWEVQFVFSVPLQANQGNLSKTTTNWELTGKYRMTITDKVTGKTCSKVVGASGEYQFAGPPLAGWPHVCAHSTSSSGQSPDLPGTLVLHGHAGALPIFAPGPICDPTLAGQANSLINKKGFDAVKLQYKLAY
jgi:hypothetical protein